MLRGGIPRKRKGKERVSVRWEAGMRDKKVKGG